MNNLWHILQHSSFLHYFFTVSNLFRRILQYILSDFSIAVSTIYSHSTFTPHPMRFILDFGSKLRTNKHRRHVLLSLVSVGGLAAQVPGINGSLERFTSQLGLGRVPEMWESEYIGNRFSIVKNQSFFTNPWLFFSVLCTRGIFVVKVHENLFISSCALPGSGRANRKNKIHRH